MNFKTKFYNTQNCLQVSDWNCGKCGFSFLTDEKIGGLICPKCGGQIESAGVLVVNRGVCTHNGGTDTHEYSPRE